MKRRVSLSIDEGVFSAFKEIVRDDVPLSEAVETLMRFAVKRARESSLLALDESFRDVFYGSVINGAVAKWSRLFRSLVLENGGARAVVVCVDTDDFDTVLVSAVPEGSSAEEVIKRVKEETGLDTCWAVGDREVRQGGD